MTPSRIETALQLRATGRTTEQIANDLGVGRASVMRGFAKIDRFDEAGPGAAP